MPISINFILEFSAHPFTDIVHYLTNATQITLDSVKSCRVGVGSIIYGQKYSNLEIKPRATSNKLAVSSSKVISLERH